jgi:hypothetical protein
MKKILIGCERSQVVCNAFREFGFEAYSCDIEDASNMEHHLKGNVLDFIYDSWDLAIFHPPCTYMSNAGARWMYSKEKGLNMERFEKAMKAKDFFMKLLNAVIQYIDKW